MLYLSPIPSPPPPPVSPPPRTIADVAKEIYDLLRQKKDLSRLKTVALLKHLRPIVKLMEELALLLRQSSHPTLAELERVLADGRSYVTELAAKSESAPEAPQVQAYLAGVAAVLDTICTPPEQKPERRSSGFRRWQVVSETPASLPGR